MSDRIPAYEHFWPFYVSEHAVPACRWLHFVGTTGFLISVAACTLTAPLTFVPCFGAALGLGAWAFPKEAERTSFLPLLGMVALSMLGNPAILVGVVFAYGMAWLAHFRVEHNRPATFTYPLWSLYSDFKMYGQMWKGRMWRGDGQDGVVTA